ncbi:DNA binding domain protein, excisionase family [Gloeothece citriformis PCC 7424]|uniref:DNA binding domain protein, excisionase family n=1 Tax=Gloeothece citriformis (strain PCC 7424) TaxID=65393 RepID=B7K7S1_GLOC7|nr:helix-turn-helix domain-containing protein [Gloeothece citriformis]ACK71117.1 DNA binding domain protein, excisionase family [Gloeothece citriformis PCC 7424]
MRHKEQNTKNNNGGDEQLLTTGEVAKSLRVHQRTVQRWISSHKLKAIKVGPRIWRIRQGDLDLFLSNQNQEETDI